MEIRQSQKCRQGEALSAMSGGNPNQLALWGAASYSPKVPSPNSKQGQVLALLLRGERLNQELVLK